jgi:hypothetical protein
MPSLRFTFSHHTFPALMMPRHYAILLAPYSRTWGGWNYERQLVAKKVCVDQMDKLSSITSSNSGHSTRALMRKWFPRYIPTYSFHTAVCKIMTVFVIILHAGCPRISSVHSQLSALSLTHTVHVGILHIWAPFSTWSMGVRNSFNIIENRWAMCILCIAETHVF